MKAKTEMKMKKLEKMYDVEFRCEKRFRPETKTYDWRGEVIENTLIRDNQISDCDFTNAVFRNCTIEFVDFRDCITDNMVFDSCSFENIAFISDNEIYMPDGVKGLPEVPFVPGLEERIYQAIQTAEGKGEVAKEVRAWCCEHGANSDMRIVLCGHAGEHDDLLRKGWRLVPGKARGGYGISEKAKETTDRDSLYLSPHCLFVKEKEWNLFECMDRES